MFLPLIRDRTRVTLLIDLSTSPRRTFTLLEAPSVLVADLATAGVLVGRRLV